MSRPRLRAAFGATAVVCVLSVVPVAMPGDAAADPGGLGDARSRASQLRASVDRLQDEAERATERYNRVQAELGRAVIERGVAQQRLDEAQQGSADGRARLQDRVRALYMAGGNVALLATVFDGGDLHDVVGRYRAVQSLVSYDRSAVDAADHRTAAAAAAEAALGTVAARITRLQVDAARAATTVTTLLAQEQSLLTAADDEVRRLAEEQRAAQLAASARAFAAALAAAQASSEIDPSLTGSAEPPNAQAATAIEAAKTRLGDPYVWGAEGPDTFDCSGLTQWSYAQAGVALPRVAADQWNVGPHPGLDELAPGDLLFWADDASNPATIHHVAIYLGGGLMIAAPHTGDVVKIQPVYLDGFLGATRPTAGATAG